jgi:hypothetical protein
MNECGRQGTEEKYLNVRWRHLQESRILGNLSVDGMILLKFILEKHDKFT